MNSNQIKSTIAAYFRYVRQYPIVAFEAPSFLTSWTGELADILVVNKERYLIEIEVKISLTDLKRDIKKRKHNRFQHNSGIARFFYFALPKEIANEAKPICENLYPYAGIIGTNGLDQLGVWVYKDPGPLTDKKLTFPQILNIVRGQSGTICRLSSKVDELLNVQENLRSQLKYYRDMEKLK